MEAETNSFEEQLYWKHIKKISFCTTFLSDSHHKIKIPKKFAENMKPSILNPEMTLIHPSGVTWEVGLSKVGDDLFLCDGWKDFANAYLLQENDVLIFKHDRKSTFRVMIFNGEYEKIDAYFVKKCRHAYPALENVNKRPLSEIEDTEDEVCRATKKPWSIVEYEPESEPVNHTGRVRRCGTRSKKILTYRKLFQSAVNMARKKARPRSVTSQRERERDSHVQTEPKHYEVIYISNDEEPRQIGSEDITLPARRAEIEPAMEHGHSSFNHGEETHQGFNHVEETCQGFNHIEETRQGFNHVEETRQGGFENVALPAIRVKAEVTKQHNQNSFNNNEVTHHSSFEAVAMPAERVLVSAETEPVEQNRQISFNNNEVAHRSSFETVAMPAKRGEIELVVQPVSVKMECIELDMEIVASPGTRGRRRSSINGSVNIECISNRRPVTDEEKINAVTKAISELPEHSFYIALPISSCYNLFYLTIPVHFAKVHLGNRNQEVHLFVGTKKWITKFSFSTRGLCSGWKMFALQNNLEESDVCVFKLMEQRNGDPVTLDVSIFRVVDELIPPTLSIIK